MANNLPEPGEELKKVIADRAVFMVCTAGRVKATLFLTTCMIENAKLLTEVNRLRALVGEPLLEVFE